MFNASSYTLCSLPERKLNTLTCRETNKRIVTPLYFSQSPFCLDPLPQTSFHLGRRLYSGALFYANQTDNTPIKTYTSLPLSLFLSQYLHEFVKIRFKFRFKRDIVRMKIGPLDPSPIFQDPRLIS